jgi:hypothetical protein
MTGTPFIGPEGAGGGGSTGVSQRPLLAPILARRRNRGEGKWGAEEVEGWQRLFTMCGGRRGGQEVSRAAGALAGR